MVVLVSNPSTREAEERGLMPICPHSEILSKKTKEQRVRHKTMREREKFDLSNLLLWSFDDKMWLRDVHERIFNARVTFPSLIPYI